MPFPEEIKKQVRQKAHFCCCVCKSTGVEIHHIIPQTENGPDTIDNAAPLCPSCHEIYGANPTKRKFIREVRDHWYQICKDRYATDQSLISDIRTSIDDMKSHLDSIPSLIQSLLSNNHDHMSDNWSIGRIFGYFLEKRFDNLERLDSRSFKFAYALVFETHGGKGDESSKVNDLEFNSLRDFFIKAFGQVIMEGLVLTNLDGLKGEGVDFEMSFTDEDMDKYLSSVYTSMIILKEHDELGIKSKGFEDLRIGIYIKSDVIHAQRI